MHADSTLKSSLHFHTIISSKSFQLHLDLPFYLTSKLYDGTTSSQGEGEMTSLPKQCPVSRMCTGDIGMKLHSIQIHVATAGRDADEERS